MNKLTEQYFRAAISEIKEKLEEKALFQETLHLQEMSNVRKKQTGLPVNIWIDEAETYKKGKHSKRIKFQMDKGLNFKEPTCPMMLDGTIPEKVWRKMQGQCSISKSEIKEIQTFVINNAYALDKLADQLIWKEDFFEFMIKGGDEASKEQIEILQKKTDEAVFNKKTEEALKKEENNSEVFV
jgi:hypothetical protein